MTEVKQVYKCPICGNIVEVLHSGAGELVCCGKAMVLQQKNTVDASPEKHVPVVTKENDVYVVRVGSDPHPMTEDHYIEWIELIVDGYSYKKYLQKDDMPEARFCIEGDKIEARAYCNLHGLWSAIC